MTPAAVGLPSILTIEDDPVLGAYVHDQLGRSGFQVTWCQNGQQGLQLARAIRLPTFEVGGLKLLKRLTLVVEDGAIAHTFYPVFPPEESARQVVEFFRTYDRG